MGAPQDHDARILESGGAAAAVIRHKGRILDRFQERVRSSVAAAARESPPLIIDTLPAFLTRLALALIPHSELSFASEYSNIASQHGNERAKLTGYSLTDVIREYQILRELIVDALRSDAGLSTCCRSCIDRSTKPWRRPLRPTSRCRLGFAICSPLPCRTTSAGHCRTPATTSS